MKRRPSLSRSSRLPHWVADLTNLAAQTIRDEAQGFLDKTSSRGSIHLVRIYSNADEDGRRLSKCKNTTCKCQSEPAVTTIRHGTLPAFPLARVQQVHRELAALPSIPAMRPT